MRSHSIIFFIQAFAIYEESRRIYFAQDGKVLAGAISTLCHGFSNSKKESESWPADNSDQATADSWEKATSLEEGQSKLWVLNSLKHTSLNWMWLAQECQTVNALMWVKTGKPKRNPLKGDSITDDATGGQQVKLRCHSCHSRTLKWYPWWTHLLLVKSF